MQQTLTGRVFDVRRFSVHDGGGIRTTVFLKGCTLACAWCHNPEGIAAAPRPLWFQKRCVGCGACLRLARHGGVTRGPEGLALRPERPENWDSLIDECPGGALAWDSRAVTVDEALDEALRDRAFFRHGGGVTLSGGEPLMQRAFAAELLARLKREGVHTAVETALNVPEETLLSVLPYLDAVYADCKLIDDAAHRRYTGASNGRILSNLKLLLEGEKRQVVTVRTPLVPGVTATEQNITGIARFVSGLYPEARYELLNWNPLAREKYALLGKTFCFAENPPRFTPAQMDAFAACARRGGARNVIHETSPLGGEETL